MARKHGVNANLLFGWLRPHRRGVLTEQRHGKSAPLLLVKIATPTLPPTVEAMLEFVLSDGARVRLYGEAQRGVLERILEQLSPR